MKKAQQPEKKGSITEEIEKLKQRREERKNKNFEDKKNQDKKDDNNGKACDAYYENLMKKKKIAFNIEPEPHVSSEFAKIFVIVRKRPISKKEILNGEIDCVSTINPKIYVHECKIKVDGITKYIEDHEFYFDNSFSDKETTEDVYNYTINPNINLILNKGIVTCFAYGQTGSGKTYTMKGIQNLAIDSLFLQAQMMNKKFDFYISFFEIYGGRLFDLLNNKNKLSVLEDKNQKVQIFGLEEKIARSPDEMREIIDLGNSIRTTHNTVTNETSSRSHAICNIVVKEQDCEEEYSKLTLVDLAGSERAQETQSNDRNRRAEGAEINKSLLALKECIRALDARKNGSDTHVPFRASKLTLVLRDSFVSKSEKSKIIMIACVGPGITSANHTINTLRYSDRLKEKTSQMSSQSKDPNNPMNININNINLPSQKNSQNVINANYLNSQPNAINNNYNINNNNNINVHLSNNNLASNAVNNNNNSNHQNQKINNNNIQANNAKNSNNNIKNVNNYNNNINNNNNFGGNINNNLISKINIPNINLNYNNQNNHQQNQFNMMNNNNLNNNNNNNNINNLYHNVPAYGKKSKINDEMINNNNNFNNNFNIMNNNNINNHNNFGNMIIPKDENLADLILDDEFINNQTDEFLSAQKIQEGEDWEYLKKTISKDGKYLSDDFIRYHQITDQIVEDEDIIITNHMNIIKEDAKMLTEEGDLITNIKGIGDELDFKMDEYTMRLEKIINKKIAIYTDLKKKIDIYKQHIREEDDIRSKLNPKIFIDN